MTSPSVPIGLAPGGRFSEWIPHPVVLVTADLDGTILGSNGSVSPGVAAAVAGAVARGVRVGFATGRMRNGVIHIHRSIGAPGPHIFHNGAEVRADETTIASWPLTDDSIDGLLETATGLGAYAELYTRKGFSVTREEPRAEVHWEMLDSTPDGLVSSRADLSGEVLKATFIAFDADESHQLQRALGHLGLQVGAARAGNLDWLFINVTMPGVHKGRAMEAAARHLGVDTSRVLAIGDGDNDREMLEVAGTAVAMGQAPEDIRRTAHLVAPSLDDDGAAVAIDRLVTGGP